MIERAQFRIYVNGAPHGALTPWRGPLLQAARALAADNPTVEIYQFDPDKGRGRPRPRAVCRWTKGKRTL